MLHNKEKNATKSDDEIFIGLRVAWLKGNLSLA